VSAFMARLVSVDIVSKVCSMVLVSVFADLGCRGV
jgi:hypothetical protein